MSYIQTINEIRLYHTYLAMYRSNPRMINNLRMAESIWADLAPYLSQYNIQLRPLHRVVERRIELDNETGIFDTLRITI